MLDNKNISEIISWLPHGHGFIVCDKERFEKEVLPVYFKKKSQYTSFTRRLNRWNFTIQRHGHKKSSYFHPSFVKGDSNQCLLMRPRPQLHRSKMPFAAAKKSRAVACVGEENKCLLSSNSKEVVAKIHNVDTRSSTMRNGTHEDSTQAATRFSKYITSAYNKVDARRSMDKTNLNIMPQPLSSLQSENTTMIPMLLQHAGSLHSNTPFPHHIPTEMQKRGQTNNECQTRQRGDWCQQNQNHTGQLLGQCNQQQQIGRAVTTPTRMAESYPVPHVGNVRMDCITQSHSSPRVPYYWPTPSPSSMKNFNSGNFVNGAITNFNDQGDRKTTTHHMYRYY
eukprot:CAMPEP_0197235814 /NCGR_PEP_ID=MMETSP1429-20130617/3149_1 /TAXON_ID=49237 /ORGANISM="Chaetoceros  sp., Strain UNC1202" /LENGTH=336 /DNA_ID=CAMNT_0042694505 /DNA_START=192 /DNA_END=1202 /DNA_ORIENTATION=+